MVKEKNLYNSKQIFDYSRNILNFKEKNPLQLSNTKKNNKVKNYLNEKEYILHMKIIKALENIKNNRKNNNYLAICDDLQRETFTPTIFTPTYDNNLNDILAKINYNFNKIINEKTTSSSLYTGTHLSTPILLPPRFIKKKVIINTKINCVNDILKLCEKYPLEPHIEYNIDMKSIHKIKKPLQDLNNMIGMKKLKESIVDQILFFIQNLHYNKLTKENDFMHTVIYGPPGTGKTEIAKIMGRIFCKLNVLSSGKFKKVTRADLIAGYLGQTAIKTKEIIEKNLGGVIFIDEAYALGNKENRDSFAKECIDTLCEGLSDHKNNLMVIIAGYEKELNECFFNYNSGLDSRFTWRFHINDYTADELKQIFEKKVKDANWSMKKQIKTSWFKQNINYFKFFGRDMETLFAKTKIAHSRRVFCKKKEEKTILTIEDLNNGLKMFLDNDEVKKRDKNSFLPDLYL
jgi:SpoVK/Ycf46/Vps4 family AAA+-type ATPase